MEQHPYTTDRHSEVPHSSSRGRPSSRGSSSRSFSSASEGTDDSRDTKTLKEGSSFGRRLSLRDRRRSPSPSGSPTRSESRHSGIRSKSHSSVKKDSRSSHSNKHSSGKRKHRDRSASPDDRKRRKRKEREREKDKEISRERKKDEERRSVLTGKKVCPYFYDELFYFCSNNNNFWGAISCCRSSLKSRRIRVITREMLIERICFNSSTRLGNKKMVDTSFQIIFIFRFTLLIIDNNIYVTVYHYLHKTRPSSIA